MAGHWRRGVRLELPATLGRTLVAPKPSSVGCREATPQRVSQQGLVVARQRGQSGLVQLSRRRSTGRRNRRRAFPHLVLASRLHFADQAALGGHLGVQLRRSGASGTGGSSRRSHVPGEVALTGAKCRAILPTCRAASASFGPANMAPSVATPHSVQLAGCQAVRLQPGSRTARARAGTCMRRVCGNSSPSCERRNGVGIARKKCARRRNENTDSLCTHTRHASRHRDRRERALERGMRTGGRARAGPAATPSGRGRVTSHPSGGGARLTCGACPCGIHARQQRRGRWTWRCACPRRASSHHQHRRRAPPS